MLDTGPAWGDNVVKPWLRSRGRDAPDGLISAMATLGTSEEPPHSWNTIRLPMSWIPC